MQVDVGPDRSASVISALTGGFAATLVQVMAAGVIVRVPATIGSEVPCHADANGGRQRYRYRGAIDWRLPGGFAATLVQVMAAGVIVRVPATIGSEVPCHVDASGGRQHYLGAVDWRLTSGFVATLMQVMAAGVIVRVPATIGSEVPCHVDANGGRQLYRYRDVGDRLARCRAGLRLR
jgi:alpha-galactosidase/6-phospho-beta-glucosidase family protein